MKRIIDFVAFRGADSLLKLAKWFGQYTIRFTNRFRVQSMRKDLPYTLSYPYHPNDSAHKQSECSHSPYYSLSKPASPSLQPQEEQEGEEEG